VAAGHFISRHNGPKMSPPAISVILIDHNHILLSGLAALIRGQPDMRLAVTGRTARDAVTLHLAHRPDFTVIDLDLPCGQAIHAIKQILSADPGAKVIGLTTFELDQIGPDALDAGVLGVIAKDRIEGDLVTLIRGHNARKS
jgi:DNA-binding NarL/FixJ family response regulator